ncbi:G1 family glutamic endopeptidase [Verrucosispora sp. WMMD573]|uniref:G1 family glutamic endopeptidase n=1 Tax=Verrucosispora sp. WMMD573 TaxID=3015149 RepID=UPI00248B501D|nr:G1 family glutamic endopeptidase [Verrucosispora sp. WMMD573]WBB56333.1 G1 family endopeptidase [Verrucosispora sp. WMMD573]
MQKTNSGTTAALLRGRGLALVVAAGTVAGSVLLGAVPAYANATTKTVASDGDSVTFTTSDSSRKVSGNVSFTINRDGNWEIAANARNGNLIGRNAHWICDLTLGSSDLRKSTGTKWVPGKKTRSLNASAYEPFIEVSFDALVATGQADCDVVVG